MNHWPYGVGIAEEGGRLPRWELHTSPRHLWPVFGACLFGLLLGCARPEPSDAVATRGPKPLAKPEPQRPPQVAVDSAQPTEQVATHAPESPPPTRDRETTSNQPEKDKPSEGAAPDRLAPETTAMRETPPPAAVTTGVGERPGASGGQKMEGPSGQDLSQATAASANLAAASHPGARGDISTERPESPGAAAKSFPVPLVPSRERLQQLHPHYPVWIDPAERTLVAVGEVCQRDVPLELFACSRGSKEHESVVSVPSPAYVLHAGLLALGAEAGSPVQFHPEFRPATGDRIEILVRWKDDSGTVRECAAQDWVQDISRMYDMFKGVVANQFEDELHPHDQWDAWQAMRFTWVFAGSQFVRDERRGREIYLADEEGVLICVANFPAALLDVPIESSTANAALLFRCFAERIPPIGTEVTLIFRPIRPANQESSPPAVDNSGTSTGAND